jgi:adenine deaminase
MNLEHISELPKAELHVHLEGTVTFELLTKLFKKNDLPIEKHKPEVKCFEDFIKIYLKISQAIKCSEDILTVSNHYFESAKRQNIKHSEIYFSPSTFHFLGHDIDSLFTGSYTSAESC